VVREYLRLKIDALGNIQIAIERFYRRTCARADASLANA
jgi:hypothetical protein